MQIKYSEKVRIQSLVYGSLFFLCFTCKLLPGEGKKGSIITCNITFIAVIEEIC